MEEVEEVDKDKIIENLRTINKSINDKLKILNRGLDMAMDKALLKDKQKTEEMSQIAKEIKLKTKEWDVLYGQLKVSQKEAEILKSQITSDSSSEIVK